MAALRDAVRRCYLSDEKLLTQAQILELELGGTFESRQTEIIKSKLPDPSSTMAGDFGEILIYAYQATKALPSVTIGPKKWRLKQDRTKPAPCSDVVHFILPTWPVSSTRDEVLCAEVKMKATNGASTPIQDAITDCEKDRISRLSRTLQWLKERALTENIGEVQIAHLNRFIKATDHPPAIRRFRAVAVISENLVDTELLNAPQQASPEYELVVVAVPNLHTVYNAVFEAAKSYTLPAAPQL
ncbi:Hachiman antiphage defense system protein HamA [Rariglobus hedericola]|uniref:Hachiman antiphage defense system protein HamA n=1 Tax=Rariglobus hedericola TaxID=2597822 RepID=UPI001939606E|nr:Hachiman antiphage defense system protein HamA [Rariglobus hedericola]